MNGAAYYNEVDPFAAEWIGRLAERGLVAPGRVDCRDIRTVRPGDVPGAGQVHFFAGIAVWSYALRLAGVPDGASIWTGSCPCQPFSQAGRKRGFSDERHLWPEWFRLIRECRPPVVFGEQVASRDGEQWLDLVSTDLERVDYAVGAAVLPAAGFGAPHGRHRICFVAHPADLRRETFRLLLQPGQPRPPSPSPARRGAPGSVAHPEGLGPAGGGGAAEPSDDQPVQPERPGAASELGNAPGQRRGQGRRHGSSHYQAVGDVGDAEGQRRQGAGVEGGDAGQMGDAGAPRWASPPGAGYTRGFWGNAEWIPCRDGKIRAVEPGAFPLAYGAPGRVGRLRAYGNAINARVAEAFIRAALGALLGEEWTP